MELRLVNQNKIKITLTSEDMAILDITYEEIDEYPDDIGTRRALGEILSQAKARTGFDAGKDKLYIQIHPDKSGGCSMILTKEEGFHTYYKRESLAYEKMYGTKIHTSIKKKRLLYMFETSEILLDVCNHLNLLGYGGKSDIFADENKYYLYLEENRGLSLDFISEYGVMINNQFSLFYLDEHTKKILSPDAVKTFSEVFK